MWFWATGQDSVTVSVWVQDTKTEIECKRFVREMPMKEVQKEQAGKFFRPGCRTQLMGKQRGNEED